MFPKVTFRRKKEDFPGVVAQVAAIDSGEEIADVYWWTEQRMGEIEVARRIAAALNATRHIPLEQLESDDPLGHAELCRLQREACAASIRGLGPCYSSELEPNILAAPAPEPKEPK